MKFFQKLSICNKCSMAFKPDGHDLCPAHYHEEIEKRRKEMQWLCWIEQNRVRLEAEMKADLEKSAQERAKAHNDMMNSAYSQSCASQGLNLAQHAFNQAMNDKLTGASQYGNYYAKGMNQL